MVVGGGGGEWSGVVESVAYTFFPEVTQEYLYSTFQSDNENHIKYRTLAQKRDFEQKNTKQSFIQSRVHFARGLSS